MHPTVDGVLSTHPVVHLSGATHDDPALHSALRVGADMIVVHPRFEWGSDQPCPLLAAHHADVAAAVAAQPDGGYVDLLLTRTGVVALAAAA